MRKFKTNIRHEAYKEKPSFPMMISEFIPRVKRNQDLFRFLFPIDGVVKNLIIFATVRSGLEFFVINAYLYSGEGQDVACIQTAFEIRPGMNSIDNMEVEVQRGDRLRLDIEGIAEVYKEISEVDIAFTISPKSRV